MQVHQLVALALALAALAVLLIGRTGCWRAWTPCGAANARCGTRSTNGRCRAPRSRPRRAQRATPRKATRKRLASRAAAGLQGTARAFCAHREFAGSTRRSAVRSSRTKTAGCSSNAVSWIRARVGCFWWRGYWRRVAVADGGGHARDAVIVERSAVRGDLADRALMAGFMVPKFMLARRARRRRNGVVNELPLLVDLLRLLQGVGLSLDQALQVVVNDFRGMLPVLSSELEIAQRQFATGRTREQSFNRLCIELRQRRPARGRASAGAGRPSRRRGAGAAQAVRRPPARNAPRDAARTHWPPHREDDGRDDRHAAARADDRDRRARVCCRSSIRCSRR